MFRSRFLIWTAYTTMAMTTVAARPAQGGQTTTDRRPNFIVIFTDNQGYGDLGCYGAKGFETPNIDRLAIEGLRFTDCYAMSACSASRAALLTGCYPPRCGVSGAIGPALRSRFRRQPVTGMNPAEVTIAELLQPLGYATAIIGKWHLGDHPDFLPTKQGFDSYFGIPYSPDMTKSHWGDPPLPLMRDAQIIEQPVNLDTITLRYTDEAVKFIKQHHDQPFFLYLPHTRPHPPLHVAEQFRGTTELGLYGDVMAEVDWSVGEVIRVVDELNLAAKTLIIYVSDNGPYLQWGSQAGSAGPFRGGIGTTLEGGMRVPCLIRWPGTVPAGATCREIVSIMDFLPTFAHLAGTRPPQDRVIDGRDLMPLLRNPTGPPVHEFFLYYRQGQLQAVRSGDWKLHVEHEVRKIVQPLPNPDGFNTAVNVSMARSLFDLRTDLREEVNLANYYPEVIERLQQYLAWGRKDIGDKLTGSIGENARKFASGPAP